MSGGYWRYSPNSNPTNWTTTNDNPVITKWRGICTDEHAAGKSDHALSITKRDLRTSTPLNGTMKLSQFPGYTVELKNYWSSPVFSSNVVPSASFPKSDATYATELIARTSPNRYDVDNLQNLVDLKDLPKLVKFAGDTLIQKGASAYLAYQFGWKPLISDLSKMLDFQSRANKRAKEIHALYERGGLHRKRDLDKVTSESTTTFSDIFVGSQGRLDWKVADFLQGRKWGSVRWIPTTLPPRDETAIHAQAMRLVFGAELSPSAVWNAIPWTWLVDWFSNVGDYLVAYNNIVPCTHSTPCIMTHLVTKRSYIRTDSHGEVSGGGGYATFETKTRSLVPATLTAGIPFLSGYQMSILGALSILRLK